MDSARRSPELKQPLDPDRRDRGCRPRRFRAAATVDARRAAIAWAASRAGSGRRRRRARRDLGRDALAQLQVATAEGSVFAVRRRRPHASPTTAPTRPSGSCSTTSRRCLRNLAPTAAGGTRTIARPRSPSRRRRRGGRRCAEAAALSPRCSPPARSPARSSSAAAARAAARASTSTSTTARCSRWPPGSPEADRLLPSPARLLAEPRGARDARRARRAACASGRTWRATSCCARAAARSTWTSTASRPTRTLLRASARARRARPRARAGRRPAGRPGAGRRAAGRRTSIETGLPFLIVRKAAKEYGTGNRLEGVFEPGERVSWSRTWSLPAARRSPRWGRCAAGARRSSRSCVVDRDEGGAEAMAAGGGSLYAPLDHPFWRSPGVPRPVTNGLNPHGCGAEGVVAVRPSC